MLRGRKMAGKIQYWKMAHKYVLDTRATRTISVS